MHNTRSKVSRRSDEVHRWWLQCFALTIHLLLTQQCQLFRLQLSLPVNKWDPAKTTFHPDCVLLSSSLRLRLHFLPAYFWAGWPLCRCFPRASFRSSHLSPLSSVWLRLSHVLFHSCIRPFFTQLVFGSASTSNIHSKGAGTSHVWAKKEKEENKP